MLDKSDLKKKLKGLRPVDVSKKNGNIVNYIQNMESFSLHRELINNQEQCSLDRLFTTIVLEVNGKVVATGSIQVRVFENETVGNIYYLMLSPKYKSPSELVHKLVFCLESLAWASKCSHVMISQ